MLLLKVILPPTDMYWRALGGGHLLQVESCSAGVTWALGYDSTPWVYTSGWGGSHFKGIDTCKHGINAMEDTKYYYVYENQRWNPLTGFNAHGLPTDRLIMKHKLIAIIKIEYIDTGGDFF